MHIICEFCAKIRKLTKSLRSRPGAGEAISYSRWACVPILLVFFVLGGFFTCLTCLLFAQDTTSPYDKFHKISISPKEVTIGGRKLYLNQNLPMDVRKDIMTRKSAALSEIVSVFEQTDWDSFDEMNADAAGLELTDEIRRVVRELFVTDAKTRQEVKKILKDKTKFNARLPLMRIIEQEKVKDADLIPIAVVYSTDTDRQVRFNSVWILENQKSAEAIPHLKKIARTDTDKLVVNYAARGLAKHNDPEGQKILINNLKDTEPAVRSSAADCLTEIRSPKVLNALENALRSEQNGGVVATLVNALRFHTGLEPNEIRKKYRGWKY